MPRKAREKNIYAIYHIMSRSISELMLFVDNSDKDYYLKLLKKYLKMYGCSLYAYCLMSNHVHLHLDTKGFDISKFMHSINTAYVQYYNKKYNRHGHLFQDRFISKILYNDAYNMAVSAYIHNNPKDMADYSGHEEKYEYSSYGIYLGSMPDRYDIIDKSFIIGLFNIFDQNRFAKHYHDFVKSPKDLSDNNEFSYIPPKSEEYEYKSGRLVLIREFVAANIIAFISESMKTLQQTSLSLKSLRKLVNYRALVAYALRVLCNLSYKSICKYLLNITVTSCSRLCYKGYELVCSNNCYLQIFNELTANTM